MKVKNMRGNSGREVANQFIIRTEKGRYFQSYDSIVAFVDNDGNVTLDNETWDYSRTTGKYRNQFLGEDKQETERKIKDGTYKLDKLN